MSAGSGVQHSEFNHEKAAETHFLQIWLEPDVRGIAPEYEQKHIPASEKRGRLRLIASPDGAEGSLKIHQDARIYAALIDGNEQAAHTLSSGRRAYVHVARGNVKVNGVALGPGDAAGTSGADRIELGSGDAAEVLLFDLP
jgi:quercetin 2,3-dioxygenase